MSDRSSSGRVEYRVQPSASLPDGYRDGFVAIIGDSRDISEGEVLHVGHPVVQAAIEDARRATASPFRVVFEAAQRSRCRMICDRLPGVAADSW